MTKLSTTLLKDLPLKQTSITDDDYVVVSSGGTKKLKIKELQCIKIFQHFQENNSLKS